MNQVFDINRTIQFARLKLNLNRKLFTIAVAGFLGLIFIISFFFAYHLDNEKAFILNIFHNISFIIMLYGGAVFFGGRAYIEMNSGAKTIEQLMVPASIFEKFIVPMVFTSIGWIIFSTIAYQIFALLTNALWTGIFSMNLEVYNIFDIVTDSRWVQSIKFYFLGHAAFFLGSAAFRKYAIPKTALAAFIIQNGMNLFGFIIILILFGSAMNFGVASGITFSKPELRDWITNGGAEKLVSLTYWASAIFLPVILYITAYFKLKEREV